MAAGAGRGYPAFVIDLKSCIRDVPDFPQPGVLFRDITPLLGDPEAFGQVLDEMASFVESRRVDAIVGIESRGFIFGMPVASRLGLPFVPVRKPGKLPSARMSVEYSLEYGNGQLDIHADALGAGNRVVIVDDLLATGGTARAAAKLVELLGATVAGLLFLIELAPLGGRARLDGYDVQALLRYE
jgi:adenine phosphoribosyltransferase